MTVETAGQTVSFGPGDYVVFPPRHRLHVEGQQGHPQALQIRLEQSCFRCSVGRGAPDSLSIRAAEPQEVSNERLERLLPDGTPTDKLSDATLSLKPLERQQNGDARFQPVGRPCRTAPETAHPKAAVPVVYPTGVIVSPTVQSHREFSERLRLLAYSALQCLTGVAAHAIRSRRALSSHQSGSNSESARREHFDKSLRICTTGSDGILAATDTEAERLRSGCYAVCCG